jgi:1,4-dihydroxy-2-naphthoate octaprenyltransferase
MSRRSTSAILSDLVHLRAWTMALMGPVGIWYFSIFYLTLATNFAFPITSVLMLTASLILYEANIVLVNDIFDRDVDRAAGKVESVRGHYLSLWAMVALFLLTGAVSWLLILLAGGTWLLYSMWVIAYVVGFFYSSPPLRLKSRGFWSLVCNSLIERPFPVLLVFLFYRYYGFELIAFPMLSELVWSVFKHQVHDVITDTKSNVRTYAVMLGKDLSYKIVKYAINPLGFVSIAGFALISAYAFRNYSLLFLSSFVLIVAGTVIAIVLERRSVVYTDPLDPPYTMFDNLALLLIVILPLSLIVVAHNLLYLSLFAVFMIALVHYLKEYGSVLRGSVRVLLAQTKVNDNSAID